MSLSACTNTSREFSSSHSQDKLPAGVSTEAFLASGVRAWCEGVADEGSRYWFFEDKRQAELGRELSLHSPKANYKDLRPITPNLPVATH
jgi:hypothetical protein